MRITSPARIRDLLASLIRSQRIGTLLRDGERVGSSRIVLRPDGTPGPASSTPADTLRIRGWNGLYDIPLDRVPTALEPVLRRADRRIAELSGLVASVTFCGHELEVLDASWTGLAVRPEGALEDGPLTLTLTPDWGGFELHAHARVAYRSAERIGLDLTCGDGEWGEWVLGLSEQLHPNTDHTAPSAQAVWEALQDWFFLIRGPGAQGFAEIKEAWQDAHAKVVDGEVQGHVVLHEGGWGTLAFLNLYSRSWTGHQLGALRRIHLLRDLGHSEQVKRDLYMHCAELMQGRMAVEGVSEWWMVATCRTASWLSRHWDFARRDARGVNVSIQPVDVNCMDPLKSEVRWTDVDVFPVTDLAPLHDLLSEWRPAAYLSALDLDPEHFHLEQARERLATAGLELHRRVFVATDAEGPMMYGLVEIATRGLNAFRLFDSLRFVPARSLSERDLERAWHALTVRAHDFFRGARDVLIEDTPRDYFVVNFEERGRMGLPDYLEQFTADPLGHGFVWVVPGEAIPAFLERIWESTPHATGEPPPPAREFPDVVYRPDRSHPLASLHGDPPSRPG